MKYNILTRWICMALIATVGGPLFVNAEQSGCKLYPIAISSNMLDGVQVGDCINICSGNAPCNFGWLTWTGCRNIPTLITSLTPPGNSDTYINPDNECDHEINIGDWIEGRSGVPNRKKVRKALNVLKDIDIIVPVWDETCGQGNHVAYRVSIFAKIRLISYHLHGQDRITVTFLGFVSCNENTAPVVDAGADQVITGLGPAYLQGIVADDGLPVGGTLTQVWTQVSGPGTAIFANSNALSTAVNFSEVGEYILELTATDSELSAADQIVIEVNAEQSGCKLYPIAISSNMLDGVQVGDCINICSGNAPCNFGWLTWAGCRNIPTLITSLTPPGNSDTYVNPDNECDHEINMGDWIEGRSGVPNRKKIRKALNVLKDIDIIVPVWDETCGQGNHVAYRVSIFAKIRLISYHLHGQDRITVTFLGFVLCNENTAPVVDAGADQVITGLGPAYLQGIVTDDGLPAGGTLTQVWTQVSGPGTAIFANSNALSTAVNFSDPGEYVLELTVTDSELSTADQIVIEVNVSNQPPVAYSQNLIMDEDNSFSIMLTADDPDGDILSFNIDQLPAHGSLTGMAPNVIYTPVPDYNGNDSFAFIANDGNLDSAPAIISITINPVNDVPISENVSYTNYEDTTILVQMSGADVDGDPITYFIADNPTHGTLSGLSSNTAIYTPFADYYGTDQFSYAVSDGETNSSIATVDITTLPVNDPPVASETLVYVNEDGSVLFILQASDVDGDTLTFEIISMPTHGSLAGTAPELTYTPDADFNGTDAVVFRVSDGVYYSAAVTQLITVVSVNDAPVINAGDDFIVDLTTNGVLSGIVVEDDNTPAGIALTILWSVVSGPGNVIFDDASALNTLVSFDAAGIYTLRLTVNDSELTGSDDVQITVNAAPVVNAGADLSVVENQPLVIDPTVTDDGVPGMLAISWNKLSGPGVALFSSPTQEDTIVTFDTPGSYQLLLSATDSRMLGSDTLTVTVQPAHSNIAPVVSAGQDQTIANISNTIIHGSATDDGLPVYTNLSITWSQVSGPGEAIFNDTAVAAPSVAFPSNGLYELQISATDGELAASDTVTVTVYLGNLPPLVDAGIDQTVTGTVVTLEGRIIDADASSSSQLTASWEQISGSGTAIFSDSSAAGTEVYFTTAGSYVLRLTGNDGMSSASDEVTITIYGNQPPLVDAGPDKIAGVMLNDNQPLPPPVIPEQPYQWLTAIGYPGIPGGPAWNKSVNYLTSGDGNLYASGYFSRINGVELRDLGMWDGCKWSPLVDTNVGFIRENSVGAIGYGFGNLFVSGGFLKDLGNDGNSDITARWDGSVWHEWGFHNAGPGVGVSEIYTTSNAVYVAGWFAFQPTNGNAVGPFPNLPVSYSLAKWSETNGWECFGDGLQYIYGSHTDPGTVEAVKVIHEGTNEIIYVGGLFGDPASDTNKNFYSGIARWDGQAWELIGGETFQATINDILPIGNKSLYVCGDFHGGNGLEHIAHVQYDEVTKKWIWSALGTGLSGVGQKMTMFDGKLYVAGGVVRGIIAWDGVTWTPLAGGVDTYRLKTVHKMNDSLYIGGAYLTSVGGKPVHGIAQWGAPIAPLITPPPSQTVTGSPAAVTISPDIYMSCGQPLTVTFNVDGGTSEYIATVTNYGDTATVDFTWDYPAGSHLVSITADNGIALPVTDFTRIIVLDPAVVTLDGSVTDDGLPSGVTNVQWTLIDGPASLNIADTTSAITTASFSEPGVYTLQLTGRDTVLTSFDMMTITAFGQSSSNNPPAAYAGRDFEIIESQSAILNGQVFDDGLPSNSVATLQWTQVSGSGAALFGNSTSGTTTVSFDAPGTYVLELTAYDGELSGTDQVVVTVTPNLNQAPVTDAGPDFSIALPDTADLSASSVNDDGLPYGHLSVSWSKLSGPGNVHFRYNSGTWSAVFATNGIYELRLTAGDDWLSSFDDVTVTVYPETAAPVAVITSPADSAVITAPTLIIGTVDSTMLDYYTLDYRRITPDMTDQEGWINISTGNTSVADGTLGTFDPTLLLNGLYQLRLSATDLIGRTVTTEPVSVIVDGNMKVGNFTISFKDLSVPLSGLPIEVVRTYDSRDKEIGDFGVGWNMSLSDIRLQKNRPLAIKWQQEITGFVTGFGIPRYEMTPGRERVITITLPDNQLFRFRAVFSPSVQAGVAITGGNVIFEPMPGTHGSLEVEGGTSEVICSGQVAVYDPSGIGTVWSGYVDLSDAGTYAPFEPRLFRFTTAEGMVFIIHEQEGLKKVIDRNGNQIQYTPAGIFHSNGQSVQFLRDSQGRITQITDPEGGILSYTYNATGDLVTFTDRRTKDTTFTYSGNHYLEDIIDPRGVQAIRCEYDSNGRLIRQTDADGNPINLSHDIPNRTETIYDRLGNSTVNEYDDNGNVIRTIDALNGITTYTYDQWDNQLTKTDPLGNTTTWTYDAYDNQISETDPLGYTTYTTYNSMRLPLTMTDAKGNITAFSYDAKGNLTNMTDAAGGAMTFVYASNGNLLRQEDALGNATIFTYDSSGNMLTRIDPAGTVRVYTYDANGNRLTETVNRTLTNGTETITISNQYNAANQLVKTINPDGTFREIEYDDAGREIARIDELGHRTEKVYNNRGEQIRIIYPDGTAISTVYDAEGRKIAETNQAGYVTAYYYDKLGRLTDTINHDGSGISTSYDAAGRTIETIDALGNSTLYDYLPGSSRRATITDALGNVSRYTYDPNGNVKSFTDAGSNTVTYVYDDLNRRTAVNFPDGTSQSTAYDALGRRIASTDQAGVTTHFSYDALSRLISVSNALGHVTRYQYDELGNQITQTDANEHTTRYVYDKRGLRTERILPMGQTEQLTYNAVGNLVSRTDFAGKTTTYTYDSMNRPLSKTPDASFNAPAVTYTYDARGLRTSMTDAGGTTTYAYDSEGRIIEKASPQGILTYTYDQQGNLLTTVSDNQNGISQTNTYDALNRLVRTTDATHGSQAIYTYDNVGNLSQVHTGNGVLHQYTYNALNRLTNLHVRDLLMNNLGSYTYTLASTGHRTGVTELSGRTVAYTYDDTHRLTSETIAGAIQSGTISYVLDKVGNRLQRNSTVNAVASQWFSYNDNDLLASDTADPNGNTTQADILDEELGTTQTVTDTYDFENRLIRRNNADGSAIEITYNGDGDRIAKSFISAAGETNTTWYLVDRNNQTGYAQVVEELKSFSNVLHTVAAYTYGLDLVSQDRWDGTTWNLSYYTYDGHGNVRQLTDDAGIITDTYSYDAFGRLLEQQVLNRTTGVLEPVTAINRHNVTINPYRYCGEQYDADLHMYFLRARYMETDRGRFWTMDTFQGRNHDPATLHKYLYCHADPVNGIDPSGEFSLNELQMVQWVRAKIASSYSVSFTFLVTKIWMPLGRAVNAFSLKFSDTIANYDRAYYQSRLLIQEIIKGGKMMKDPGGVESAIRYISYGWYKGSYGFYELVIDLKTQTILHFLFVSKGD